ncbi:hypothetical protein [Criibacterium bergeronii]|uniref:Uncharacterized protein n=1 Tax=Criibacterium bergeronii TaxID=1871336 RepID=A0A371ILI4_9FIRM|nr:hypothetical protein [Criibacterium bergeronii]MBS6062769.1 hypothetical protein [Peptostreptococcaceae bacterium]RDY21348.1 hypothetical protein BBG48_005320 [Criibacterium bergeronii]
MTKRTSRIIASIMLIVFIIFISYALNHPEGSFPWMVEITYLLFALYIGVMIFLFVAPFKNHV